MKIDNSAEMHGGFGSYKNKEKGGADDVDAPGDDEE